MKHSQNIKARILYLIVLFILFEITFKILNISLNTAFYGIFFALYLGYYIFDILNFNTDYKPRDLIYSVMINSIVFYVLILFYKKSGFVIAFFGFTALQNIFRYIFIKIFKKNNRVAIVGDGVEGRKIKDVIIKNNNYNYIGFIEDNNGNSIGNLKDIKDVVKKYEITEVVYIENLEDEKFSKIILDLKLSGIDVEDSIAFLEKAEGKVDIDNIDRNWVLKSPGFNILNSSLEQRIKRTFDIVMAIIIFIVGLPFMAITYFLVKLDDPKNFIKNPAFFKQSRIGAGGNEFNMIKFRSMRVHDPEKFSKYAGKNDSRITLVGKFIRKTRLDELPQLINVLKGDMSFVGPRPEWDILGREYENKINLYRLRYAVKPGLTGWAQVMYPYGENIDDAKKKLEYDVYYIKHQNFILDMIIFFKTIKTVIFGKGM